MQTGALFINSHGLKHPSQQNYFALFAGDTRWVKGDTLLKEKEKVCAPNLLTALRARGLSFIAFSEGATSPDFRFAHRHNPWMYFKEPFFDTKQFQRDTTVFPRRGDDRAFRNLPTVAFVIPNDHHNGHGLPGMGLLASKHEADEWLSEKMQPYIDWARTHNSLFILTWDEAEPERDCNHIATLFVGPMVKTNHYSEYIDHYSVLRTIEDIYRLSPLEKTRDRAIHATGCGEPEQCHPIVDAWTDKPFRGIENLIRCGINQ
jgi:acid phosphatase